MQTSTLAATGLLGASLLALLTVAVAWRRPGSTLSAALLLVLTALAAAAAGTLRNKGTPDVVWSAAIAVACGLCAALGGGPLTYGVFTLVDRASSTDGAPRPSIRGAGQVLRGGAWIGTLERTAVFAALVCRWPEGIALTVALKGLGRYPELRNEEHSGIAERFLIGTFTSVLWACAWAGITLAALA